MMPSLEEAQRFLGLAKADLAAFELLAGNPEIRRAIAFFHAQQAVEKCLKAILFAHGVEFHRTHDLLQLAGNIAATGIALPYQEESLLKLNPFAVELRYDDQVIPRLSDEEARRIATRTLAWAEALVTKAQ